MVKLTVEKPGRTFLIISAMICVATEKFVAVPASHATTAIRSIPRPSIPSVFSLRIDLQASE